MQSQNFQLFSHSLFFYSFLHFFPSGYMFHNILVCYLHQQLQNKMLSKFSIVRNQLKTKLCNWAYLSLCFKRKALFKDWTRHLPLLEYLQSRTPNLSQKLIFMSLSLTHKSCSDPESNRGLMHWRSALWVWKEQRRIAWSF